MDKGVKEQKNFRRQEETMPEKSCGFASEELQDTFSSMKKGGQPLFSVDIGTTTVAMELYDSHGNKVDSIAENNAQIVLGSDVMMRLMHVREGRGEQLTGKIREQIYVLGKELLTRNKEYFGDKTIPERIAVVGNTVMCHLLLGKDTKGLMGAPFVPSYQGTFYTEGGELGWENWRNSKVVVLPGIAAHVGADAMAMVEQLRLWDSGKIQLAVDLGTNAEIVLNVRGTLSACSTAAGPAFEGSGISCGKRAGNGVINGIKMMRGNESIVLDVISDVEPPASPVGLCGSALVDAVAELLQNRLLRPDGYLLSAEEAMCMLSAKKFAHHLCETEDGSHAFILYHQGEKRLVITQNDIRAFQLAKAAIRSGMEMLLQRQGITVQEVEELHIAGVFGGFLHPDNARKTGLLPGLSAERLIFDGNAAGNGAAEMLLRPELIGEMEMRAGQITHVELAEEEQFTEYYMNAMELCSWGAE